MRQEIAILFFALAMMIFFDEEIGKLNKKMLFLVFTVGTIFSHYSTAYVFFFLILFYWLTAVLARDRFKLSKGISGTTVAFFFAVIFLWYGIITGPAFEAGTNVIASTFRHLGDIFVGELRGQSVQLMSGMGAVRVPDKIGVIIYNITFLFIIIGCLAKWSRKGFDKEYLLMLFLSLGMLIATVILPVVSKSYSGARLYQQFLVILAPAFIIGGHIFGWRRSRNLNSQIGLFIVVIVLIALFFSSTFVIHQAFGVPYSEDLNKHGFHANKLLLYDQEVIAAKWLCEHNENNLKIYGDYAIKSRITMGYDIERRVRVVTNFFENNETINDGYVYLRRGNIIEGVVHNTNGYNDVKNIKNMTEYSHLLVNMSKTYSNGGAEIYDM